jgi:hypothetical protein
LAALVRSLLCPLPPVAPVADLKPALSLAPDHEIAVPLAQLNLPGVSASSVNFFGYRGRLFETPSRTASRNVAASIDANGCRLRVEVGLEHRLSSASSAGHLPDTSVDNLLIFLKIFRVGRSVIMC